MPAEPSWPIYSLKLKSRSEVAERTLEVRFERPHGMIFKAGQFMDLTLVEPPETDAEGNARGFSINSAPDDSDTCRTTPRREAVQGQQSITSPARHEWLPVCARC